jgi:DNA primase
MPRAIWKGAISFGLVHIPVELYPAEDMRADTFNVRNLRQRMSELKDDPWKDYWKLKQKITDEMLNLFDKR